MKRFFEKIHEIKNLEYYYVDLENIALSNVVNKTLYYYVKNAILYKYLFFLLSFFSISLNASIPIINQIVWKYSNLAVTIISACATIITGMLALLCLRDAWHRNRVSAEKLKTECNQFNAKLEEYLQEETRIQNFIKNFEKINSDERCKWSYEKEEKDRNKTNF